MLVESDATPFKTIGELFSLTGQRALITGAGSIGEGIGIGRACSIVLASAGAEIGLVDSSADALEATLKEVRSATGVEGEGYICDVSDASGMRNVVESFAEKSGRIDILINNVGIVGPRGRADEVDLNEWDVAMAVNVKSMVISSGLAFPYMKLKGGVILNMSSVSAFLGGYHSLGYPTTKGAILSLTRTMAAHYGPFNIRVNSIAPGPLFTPRIRKRLVDESYRDRRKYETVLGTEGTGWDAAFAALYLVSRAARWVTGEVLRVDAGYSTCRTNVSPPVREDG